MSEQIPTPTSDITSDDKLWALLNYILTPIVPIIVLLLPEKKNRPFLKAHTWQALILGVILWVINMILTPVMGIGCITSIATLVIVIYYGVKAYQGEVFDIPVITNFVKGQGWA